MIMLTPLDHQSQSLQQVIIITLIRMTAKSSLKSYFLFFRFFSTGNNTKKRKKGEKEIRKLVKAELIVFHHLENCTAQQEKQKSEKERMRKRDIKMFPKLQQL